MTDTKLLETFFHAWDAPDKAIRLLRKHPELASDHEILFDLAERWPAKVLRELIKQGADVNSVQSIRDSVKRTPIYFAMQGANFANVKLLLNEGADPFFGDAIAALVFDGIHQKSTTRFKILKAIIDAGFDINAELQPIVGVRGYLCNYNLYAHAEDCDDKEVLKFLDKNGGKKFKNESGFVEAPPLKIDTLQNRLSRALKKGWAEIKRERKAKGETFYVFGIVTDSDCQTVIPVCNTHELAHQEFGGDLDACPAQKYDLCAVKKLYDAGGEHLVKLNSEIASRDFRRYGMKKILRIFEGALADLDRKHFFGQGKNRSKILLIISFADADEREEKLELQIIRRLNPREAYRPYMEMLKGIL